MELSVRFDAGSGPPVALLHGFPGNGEDWMPVARRMSEQCRVVVVDLLGFGVSPRPSQFDDLWADAQADALAATLDQLRIDRSALVGHDMGGPVSIPFIQRFPGRVTHLALLSTNAFGDTPVDMPLSLLRMPVLGRLLEPVFFGRYALAALGRVASRTPGVHPAHNDAGEARTIRTIFRRVLRYLPELYAEMEGTLHGIGIPTVVIWGDRDMFFSAEQGQRTASAIPGAEFVLLEDCGHFPPIEPPERVAAELLELVVGHEPRVD